jgi:hypothetical protein
MFAASLWLFVATTHAQLPAPVRAQVVRLSIPDCEGAPGVEIAKLATLELARQMQVRIDDAHPATLEATLSCTAMRAVISVQRAGSSKPLLLALALESTAPEARTRLLALAIAELVATSQLEQTSTRPPDARSPETHPPHPPDRRARTAAVSPQRAALWLGLGVLRGFEPARWAPSLALGGALGLGLFAATADLGFDWSQQRRREASVAARVLSVSLAPRLRLARRRWAWDGGVGLRLGMVWLSARARDETLTGRSVSGLLLSPIVQSALSFAVAPRWALRLGLELGYAVRSVRGLDADGALLLAMDKLRVCPSLAVELAL